MTISFNVLRTTALGIILFLLVAFAGLYLFAIEETIDTLSTVAYQQIPVFEKLLVVIRYSDEIRRLFDIYVRQPRIYPDDVTIPLDQLIVVAGEHADEDIAPGAKAAAGTLLKTLQRLRVVFRSYFAEEDRNPGGTATIDLRNTVFVMQHETSDALEQVVFPHNPELQCIDEHTPIMENLFRAVKNTFERYTQQRTVRGDEILAIVRDLYTECSLLEPLLPEQEGMLIVTALRDLKVFETALRSYIMHEEQDPASAGVDEMREAAVRANSDMRMSLQEVMDHLREHIILLQKDALHRAKQMQQLVVIGLVLGSGITFFIAFLFTRILSQRITVLTEGAQQFAQGNWQHRIVIDSQDQFGRLADTFNNMVSKLHKTTVSKEYVDNILSTMSDALIILSPGGLIVDVNMAACVLLEYKKEVLLGQAFDRFTIEERSFFAQITEAIAQGAYLISNEVRFRTQSGKSLCMLCSAAFMKGEKGGEDGIVLIGKDISDRKKAEEEKRRLEQELSQAQKLESIGTLAAGIAHEINTPIQFIGDNAYFLGEGLKNLLGLVMRYKELLHTAGTAKEEEIIQTLEKENDFPFLEREMPQAVKQIREGVGRVSTIVNAMKNYAHLDDGEKTPGDINEAIETTIVLSRNEWKHVADIEKELDPALPLVMCFIAEIKQVMLNLIINATHAIKDAGNKKGRITITTRLKDKKTVRISISDTGTGIPEEVRDRVFDPFFTTKGVGKGTGQGLSIAYKAVVERHKGRIYFDSILNQGTTFYIELPVE